MPKTHHLASSSYTVKTLYASACLVLRQRQVQLNKLQTESQHNSLAAACLLKSDNPEPTNLESRQTRRYLMLQQRQFRADLVVVNDCLDELIALFQARLYIQSDVTILIQARAPGAAAAAVPGDLWWSSTTA